MTTAPSPSQAPTSSAPQTLLAPLPRRPRLLLRCVRIAAMLTLVAGVSGAYLGYRWLKELRVFTIDQAQLHTIIDARASDNSLVYDRDGQKIGEFFSSYHVFLPFKDLPKDLVNAIVATEDRTFWQHHGFDPKGILRAALAHVRHQESVQGASTITQQVVRNFLLPKERSLQRKVQEVALAIQLEKHLSKERIFEIYANSMFLGNGSYGVGAAAFRYFGKSVQELDTHEAALIAGLFQSPSRYNPSRFPARAKQRQTLVLHAMCQEKMLTVAAAKALMKRPLVYQEYRPLNAAVSPYFIDFVQEQAQKLLGSAAQVTGQGLRIYTTLDSHLQKLAEQSIADAAPVLDAARERTAPLRFPSGELTKASIEAALLSVDPRTGEILAMVGGRDYAKTKYNRTTQALRSPGSAFKPVVYSLALANKWKWSDVIFVSPITINNYRPHTPDDDFLTETTLLRAFYRSMNTPTIELGQKLGLRAVLAQAKLLGIRSPVKEEFGSMLGSSDVTMQDMARMYATFANAGRLVEQTAITKIVDRSGKVLYEPRDIQLRSTQAVSPQIAFLMNQGMRAVLQVGTGFAAAHLGNVAAGKTGTSNESTDNWFCGFAPNLATVVWVGTDEHAAMYGDITGAKLALPIWDKFMTNAFAVRAPLPFHAPPGIVTTYVHPKYGSRSPAGIRMYFLRGLEPADEPSALEALSQSASTSYRDVFNH